MFLCPFSARTLLLTARALCATIKYMNDTVIDILYTERVAPPRRFIRSDTALYVLLLLGALGIITLGNRCIRDLGATALYVQAGMYALLLGGGYLVYRFRLRQLRYTLTDKGFCVDFITGRGERPGVRIPLEDIFYAGPYDARRLKKENCGPGPHVRVGKLADTLMLLYRQEGKIRALCISPGPELRAMLTSPWAEGKEA